MSSSYPGVAGGAAVIVFGVIGAVRGAVGERIPGRTGVAVGAAAVVFGVSTAVEAAFGQRVPGRATTTLIWRLWHRLSAGRRRLFNLP